MKIHTYEVIDQIKGVRVLRCREVDWPIRELLKWEAVDIESYRQSLEQELSDSAVPLTPAQVHPFLPSRFRYRPGPDADIRSVEGIVLAEDAGALVRFAEDCLIDVEDNTTMNGYLQSDQDHLVPGLERRGKLVSELRQDLKNRRQPYCGNPLVRSPLETWNTTDQQNRHGTLEMHERSRDGSTYLFLSGYFMEYFLSSNLRTNNRQIREEEGRRNSYLRYQPPSYQPFYYASRSPGAEESRPVSSSLDRLRGMSSSNQKEIDNFQWSAGSDSGVISDPKNLPLSLLDNLDQRGRQIDAPDELASSIPVPSLDVEFRFDVEALALKKELGTTISPDQLDHPLAEKEILDRRWYVQDLRSPGVNVKDGEDSTDEKSSGGSDSVYGDASSARLLAYILQRSRHGLYAPDNGARPTSVHDLGMKELSFALGEVAV